MIKKTLMVMALLSASIPAFAMLGETRTQSVRRYGKPMQVVGNTCYYHAKAYVIACWFDSEGICELIGYYKLQGEFTKAEADKLIGNNLPPTIHAPDWIEQNSVDPDTRAWLTVDGQWYLETGHSHLGGSKHLYADALVATRAGFTGFMEESKQRRGEQQTEPAISNDDPKSDI